MTVEAWILNLMGEDTHTQINMYLINLFFLPHVHNNLFKPTYFTEFQIGFVQVNSVGSHHLLDVHFAPTYMSSLFCNMLLEFLRQIK